MLKAVFIDRDETINKCKKYLWKIEDLEFIENALEGMKKLSEETDYNLIIFTNQAGIARGLYTEEDYYNFRDSLHKKFCEGGIYISKEYFCPHHPTEGIEKYKQNCNCRKPKTGMLEQAAKDFRLNLNECWLIGDFQTDIECGNNAGCKTIQVLTGNRQKTKIKGANYIAKDLLEAAEIIIKNE